MEVTGKMFIDAIVKRLADKNVRCYDSAIVQRLSSLSAPQLMQLVSVGDIQQWHNDRIDSDYVDLETRKGVQ